MLGLLATLFVLSPAMAVLVLSAAVAGGGLVWAVHAATAGRLTAGDVTAFVAAVAGVQVALLGLVGGWPRRTRRC
ncbi:hypothetical protein ACH44C_21250 [Streptomyces purpureus]|uniref:hypothetical protein n=1 Tax=Streptomyces purpureus TaxID=1951 RepID=UPI00039D8521